MSHFTVYVFTKENGLDYDELLAPYDENIECAPYVKYTKAQAIAHVRKDIEDYKHSVYYTEYMADPEKYKEKHSDNPRHIDYLENVFPKKLNWTDEECYEDIKQFYTEDEIDEEGNLYSTYNPKSKWDWYSIGGRWNGSLITNDGKETNEDYANQIDWYKTCMPFAFITPDGEWHEKGEMGWWAIVDNEKEAGAWEKEFRDFVSTIGDDIVVTLVDCHI